MAKQSLKTNAKALDRWLADAGKHHRAGRFADAEALYRKVLGADPGNAEGLHGFGVLAYQHGRHDIALELIARAIAQKPDQPGYYNSFGAAMWAVGRATEAEASYRRGLVFAPGSAELNNNLSNVLRARGDLDGALACCRVAAAAAADSADIQVTLAETLALQGKNAEALVHFRRAAELNPHDAAIVNAFGIALCAAGRIEEALDAHKRALALAPQSPDLHRNLGTVLHRLGRYAEAAACHERAIVLDPKFAAAYDSLGFARHMQRRYDDAAAAYEKALALEPNNADVMNSLGFTREDQDRLAEAADLYARAIALNPRNAVALNNLGNVRRTLGDFAGANARYDEAIAADPRYLLPVFNRAELKTFTGNDPDIAALEALVSQAGTYAPDNAVWAHFALGKAYADVGDHDRAFAQFLKGNALKRVGLIYDERATQARLDEIARAFDRDVLARAPAQSEASPIFVVGLPRSGTTLIEQILASHADLQAVGETRAFEQALEAVFGAPVDITDAVRRADLGLLEKLAATYLALLPPLETGKTRIVDKLPGNFQNIGFIRLALPNARIVHATRDPVDTCVSCFTKLFREGHEYTYDLAELGRFAHAYTNLMAHWRSVLPQNAVLDVAYEDIVGDLEGTVRRLLAYCGLEFDVRCLAFHETPRPIGTASAQQVRKPLYRTALGRARHYEAHLEPLRVALAGA